MNDDRNPDLSSGPADDGHAVPRSDVVVVGGGLAGLTAAITAARAGRSVTLLETRDPGGRSAVTEVEPGVLFNGGPHAFYRAGAGARVLGQLGIRPHGAAPDTGDSYVSRDGTIHRLPGTPASLLGTKLLAARSKLAIALRLGGIQRLDAARFADRSIGRWMSDVGLAPDATAFVRTLLRTTTYVDDVDRFSADAALRQLQIGLEPGVLYLDRGFGQLVDSLTSAARSAGVEVADHEPVRGVEAGPARTWSVRTGRRDLRASAVVIAAGSPAAVSRLAPEPIDLGGLGPAATAACLELAVTRPPDHALLLGVGDPLYLSRHTPASKGLAADGITVVHVMRYGARSADEDRRDLWCHAERMGLRPEHVVAERFLARMVVTGGFPVAEAGGLAGRPRVEVAGPRARGLFIAGDWVGDEGLLADASLASGHRAGRLAAAIGAATRDSSDTPSSSEGTRRDEIGTSLQA